MVVVSETYPQDEFDEVPEGGPAGVHRRSRSVWAPVIPFILVLVFVPLIAWGVATLIQRNVPAEEIVEVVAQSEQVQSDGVTEEEEVVEAVIPDSDVPTAAPDDPTQEALNPDAGATPDADNPEAAPVVDYSVGIEVLNGTTIAGYAGEVAGLVTNAGFTNVVAGNAGSWPSDMNAVYYATPDLKATAEAVAAATGIDMVTEAPFEGATGPIVVFLIN